MSENAGQTEYSITNDMGELVTRARLIQRLERRRHLPLEPLGSQALDLLRGFDPEVVHRARELILLAKEDGFTLCFEPNFTVNGYQTGRVCAKGIPEEARPYFPVGWAPVPSGAAYTEAQMAALGFSCVGVSATVGASKNRAYYRLRGEGEELIGLEGSPVPASAWRHRALTRKEDEMLLRSILEGANDPTVTKEDLIRELRASADYLKASVDRCPGWDT